MVGDSTEIDVARLEASLQVLLTPENTFGAFKSCIFKTPDILQRHNLKAYTPDAFSIGPMHHGKPALDAAQKIKTLYFRDFLGRSTAEMPFDLRTVIEVVKKREAEARACYAEGVSFTREKLVEILVLDGCFLIELFCRSGFEEDPDHPDDPIRNDPEDPIRTKACMYQYLYHDLVLLENQIPWFVLEDLFSQTMMRRVPRKSTLKRLVVGLFSHHFSTTNPLSEPADRDYKCKHILDLIRESLVSQFEKPDKAKDWKRMSSAVALSEAGVKLVPAEKRSSIFDVRFNKSTHWLEIPHVLITQATEATFRNLISYEQCYPGCEPIVTSYVILMDNLVDRSEDLEELCMKGIVENWLDPQEATNLFNSLYSDANVNEFYYIGLSRDVDSYCKKWWPKWQAWYKHNYFTKPWAIVSQVVGVVVLILTVLQTVFTVYR